MRLRKKHHLQGVEINIAPLIDVVLLLIIFFMVIAQFTRLEVEALELPKAQHGDSPSDPLDRQIIVNMHSFSSTLRLPSSRRRAPWDSRHSERNGA